MYTICLDIGFRFTGCVVYCGRKEKIVHTHCIRIDPLKDRPSKAQQHFDECKQLSMELRKLFYCFPGAKIMVESPSGGGKSSIAVKSMASCVAVLASLCASMSADVTLVTPLALKRLVRAKGAVDKDEVMKLVEDKLTCIGFKYPNKYKWCRDHVADASAILLIAEQMGLINLKLNQ